MTTRFLTITKRIFHTTLLALSPLLFATTATAQNAAGDLPFEPSEAESRITKVMAKQIEQQPYNFATIRVSSCTTDRNRQQVEVGMDKGFADFHFDEKSVKAVTKAVKKSLFKPYRRYTVRVTVGGIDIADLTGQPPRYSAHGTDQWGDIDYRGRPWVSNVSSPLVPTHGLYNRHLSLWASHGRFYDVKKGVWRWQRPKLFGTTEDLFTPTLVGNYLIPMLEQAGAVVFTPRERDTQPHELIVDNDAPQLGASYIEVGGRRHWQTAPCKGFAWHDAPYDNGDNPFEAGTVRMANTTKKKRNYNLISYQPRFPEEGEYAVYVSYSTLPKSVDDAHYTVWHQGVKTELRVNQRMGGGTWVYLGTFRFDKGSNEYNRVVVTNQSERKGVVTSDAVRFGGGMGNIRRGGQVSGLPRCLEGARYYAQWAGMAPTVYDGRKGTDDYADDINTRSLMSNWIAGGSCYAPDRKGTGVPLELSLGVHSDAGYSKDDGVLTGSLGICTTQFNDGRLAAGISREASKRFATLLTDNLQHDLRQRYGRWVTRGVWDRNYSETRLPAVPSAILETLSHQNFSDMQLGQHPEFRFEMARSVYKTILRFVSSQHGQPCIVSPLTPTNLRVHILDGGVAELAWDVTEDPSEPSAHPNGFIVYTKEAGDFDNGTYIHSTNRYRLQLQPGVLYSFRVAAANRGGRSFASAAVSARWMPDAQQSVLIVDACHRLSAPAVRCNASEQGFDLDLDPGIDRGKAYRWAGRQLDFRRSRMGIEGEGGLGWSDDSLTGLLIAGDEGNRIITHAEAIAAASNCQIESCDSRAWETGQVDSRHCQLIDVATALQREDGSSRHSGKALTEPLQRLLDEHAKRGGSLLVNGAYVATDLVSASDNRFLSEVLKCSLAGAYRQPNDTLKGMGTEFYVHHRLNSRHYAAPAMDILQAEAPAFTTLQYANGTGAAIAYKGSHRAVTLGFPLECVKEPTQRTSLMRALLQFLLGRD